MNPRFRALQIIESRKAKEPDNAGLRPGDLFGANVFDDKAMRKYLARDVYKQLREYIDQGEMLERAIAGPVAHAIKAWAIDLGATHFTHWFQPLNGSAAEKHDSFLEVYDGEPIERFSGEELAQQEPDTSPFPTGGVRSTFEARGYTAWDCSSSAFIFETPYTKTLCIPTVFVSYTGASLDYKLPLLKSISLLNEAAVSVCHLFDKSIKRVIPTLGAEQEFYLVDRSLYDLRPDLILAGRTLVGVAPVEAKQHEGSYFGSISERAFGFFNDLEQEAYRLGIPLKTRHNEVAPGQFEVAPHFEELNIAVDHGQLLMDLIERIAWKHDFKALMHEKPFAGVNGSGKHNNWSISTNAGKNLLSPGSNPKENLMFLTFFTCIIRAVYEHPSLLQASVASPGNDLRLNGQEAPPGNMSVFVGKQLSQILDDIENPPRKRKKQRMNPYLKLGISKIPELLLGNTDRNRTSPFAFTGKKFELRAVGASANCSHPMMVLNVIVAHQLRQFVDRVNKKMVRGRKKELAILDIIREHIIASKDIRFEGESDSDEWKIEALKRGWDASVGVPKALDAFISDKSVALFVENGIFSKNELLARHEILLRNYLKQIRLEADVVEDLIRNQVIPEGLQYQSELWQNLEFADRAKIKRSEFHPARKLAQKSEEYLADLGEKLELLKTHIESASMQTDFREAAVKYNEEVLPLLKEIRHSADALEGIIPDGIWPLPKYRELLFLK